MKTKEILKHIEENGGFYNLNHWGRKEVAEYIYSNYNCSRYVGKKCSILFIITINIMRAHLLFSQAQDQIIMSFDSFDKELIKKGIIEYLTENPTDVVEHCREYSKTDLKKICWL